MTIEHSPTSPPSFFIAGTMQGSRRGIETADQSYRLAVRRILQERYPDCTVHCPHEIMQSSFGSQVAGIRQYFNALQHIDILDRMEHSPTLASVLAKFDELVSLAARSTAVIAFLPGHQASMGTAIEMWSAHLAGTPVVTVTEMKQNLAVLAASDVVVASLTELELLLGTGWLERRLDCGSVP